MIVILAGMQRSGSTFAFNVVRDVLRRRGSVHHDASYDIPAALAAAGDAAHLLLKTHDMDPLGIALARAGAVRVICTVRRPEDSVASFMQVFGFSETDAVAMVKAWLGLYARLRPVALTVDYDLIDRHPIRAARTIGRFLCPDVGWREAAAVARRHSKRRVKAAADRLTRSDATVRDLGYSYYDQDTLYHRNHVSSLASQSAKTRLPAEQVTRIRKALAQNGA